MFKKINRKNKKGFTLAELLIVVAIIGVLVAVSIPIFTAQLEKSREATDLANVRSAYAELMADYLDWDGTSAIDALEVPSKQTQAKWQSIDGTPDNATISEGAHGGISVPAKTGGAKYKLTIDTATGAITVA